jgi:large subunit ribosomal protein L13
MKIIDASNLIVGRLASMVAKELLRGEKVVIVRAEEGVITGSKSTTFKKYLHRRQRKSIVNPARHGPFFPREPEGIIRRAVRGMLPYKKPKGRKAYKNLRVYAGLPKEYEKEKIETLEPANVTKLKIPRFIKLKALSSLLGAKVSES